jgi:hypothetical protein
MSTLELLREEKETPVPEHLKGAWAVLRRGLSESPELRRGLWLTVVVSLGVTISSLVTPVLVQQVFDHGFTPEFDPGFVYTRCAEAFGLVLLTFVAARAAGRRLVTASEVDSNTCACGRSATSTRCRSRSSPRRSAGCSWRA